MWRLVKYLEENDPETITRNHNELVQKLHEIWPTGGLTTPTREHVELAAAVASSLWLGRQAQVIKESSGDKSAEQFFREAIMVAFETGRRSAIAAP